MRTELLVAEHLAHLTLGSAALTVWVPREFRAQRGQLLRLGLQTSGISRGSITSSDSCCGQSAGCSGPATPLRTAPMGRTVYMSCELSVISCR